MLIISKFHDYYDTAIAHGVDKTVTYSRDTQEFKGRDYARPVPGRKYSWLISGFVVGFCGALYPGALVRRFTDHHDEQIFYSLEDFERWLKDAGVKDKDQRHFWPGSSDLTYAKARAEHFKPETHVELGLTFSNHRVPIFLSRKAGLTLNPPLREWKFQKVKDPFTAFQEIYMFISGVLGVDASPMITISDKDKAAKAGHDGEYSFRKPPGGGRWR